MAKDLGCNKTRKLLALLPGSDLPPELDQPVRDHLAGCRVCQRQLGDHLRVRSALSGLWSRTGPPERPWVVALAPYCRQNLKSIHPPGRTPQVRVLRSENCGSIESIRTHTSRDGISIKRLCWSSRGLSAWMGWCNRSLSALTDRDLHSLSASGAGGRQRLPG